MKLASSPIFLCIDILPRDAEESPGSSRSQSPTVQPTHPERRRLLVWTVPKNDPYMVNASILYLRIYKYHHYRERHTHFENV